MQNLLNSLKKDCWFQIGTNTGIDNFRQYVNYYKPKKVILVEANSSLIDDINKNYDSIKMKIKFNAFLYQNFENIGNILTLLTKRLQFLSFKFFTNLLFPEVSGK